MVTDTGNDLSNVLIRAGRRAWNLYNEAKLNHSLDEDVAVSLLAKHMVALATKGTTNEGQLAAAGLRYLISLSMPSSSSLSNGGDDANKGTRQPFEFRLDRANAKFVLEWRVRLLKAASVSSAGIQAAVQDRR